ncbi:MAG: M3 family oligoendopeptidase [Anaerolineaceae bacterium]|nr:MAG: M3 family oligoendopeptidase [Anaerolineaceae bacterium]
MDFKSLPADEKSILAMTWQDYEPYFNDLESRTLDASNVDAWLDDWSALSSCVDEQFVRLQILTTQYTADEDIQKRYADFIDQIQSPAKTADQRLKEKLLASGLQPGGYAVAFKMMKSESEIFRTENLPLLAEEQKLVTEYDKIMGATTVMWDGQEKTFWEMVTIYWYDPDRSVRERAWRAIEERKYQNRDAINELWGKFMALRSQIAQNTGYPDYRAYIWKQKLRFDYTPEDCKSFHAAIEEAVVPAARRIYARREKRLGLEATRPWDVNVDQFNRPALRPAATVAELNERTLNVFEQVDPQFRAYYQSMMDNGLLDLDSRKNKASGAYSLGFNVARLPFIFMGHTNSAIDVSTILHEGGHAFHTFESASLRFHQKAEQYVPAEFAEVASMGMELLAAPHLSKQFGGYYTEEEVARARIEHMESIITFWPYMALVDAFQHWIYENHEEASDGQRCETKWGELWDRFMQGIDYSGLEKYKNTYWHQQGHIHTTPFYYVEYGLAQLGAVQVFANARKDQKKAVENYRKALALGSTVSLPELFAAAGATFAFDAATLKEAVDLLEDIIAEQEARLS